MAVAKEVVLEADTSSSSGSDEDPSRCETLSDDDNEEINSDYDHNDDINDVNDEIKQAVGVINLSNEALKLLRHASRSIMKRKQRRIKGRRRETIINSLYTELQSLRNLIPPHHFGGINKQPCVIADALDYLKLLKQEIKDLNELLLNSMGSDLRTSQDAQVEMISSDQRLEIHVSCNKRTGLLAQLMLVLESTGLVFDDVDASCHHRLLFQASSTQKGVHLLDKQAIRRAVLREIHKN